MSRLDVYLPPAPPADPVPPDPDIDPEGLPPAKPALGFVVLESGILPNPPNVASHLFWVHRSDRRTLLLFCPMNHDHPSWIFLRHSLNYSLCCCRIEIEFHHLIGLPEHFRHCTGEFHSPLRYMPMCA